MLLWMRPFLPLDQHSYNCKGRRHEFDSYHFKVALLVLCYTPFGTGVNLNLYTQDFTCVTGGMMAHKLRLGSLMPPACF